MNLFKLIEETSEILENNRTQYETAEKNIVAFFTNIVIANDNYIGNTSRIKGQDSLKSKIVRNKYYLNFDKGEEILNNMPDLVGLTLECRFKDDEKILLDLIRDEFIPSGTQYHQAQSNPSIYLNLKMPQPQKQKNGFDDYRIDGYYCQDGKKTNFELQIKSLINIFWSDIEHEVIYKNNNYLFFDNFLKEMLNSIKNNLDTIDFQLAKIYEQMTQIESNAVGIDDKSFKSLLGKSINDLFSIKLKETINIETNIKKISALLSHYIYIEDFVKSEQPQIRMVSYLEKLNLLAQLDVNFTNSINIKEKIDDSDPFTKVFGGYCLKYMNIDFDWHVLFAMLFMLQEDELVTTFNKFIKFIKEMLFSPTWFQEQINICQNNNNYVGLDKEILNVVAQTMVKQKSVEIIYEEHLYDVMILIRDVVEGLVNASKESEQSFLETKNYKLNYLKDEIEKVFNKES